MPPLETSVRLRSPIGPFFQMGFIIGQLNNCNFCSTVAGKVFYRDPLEMVRILNRQFACALAKLSMYVFYMCVPEGAGEKIKVM